MGLGYDRCLLRRRLGRRDVQQPARIHLPFSWKWPLLDPLRGGNVPGHDSFEGQLPAWIRCQHSGAAASPGRIRVIRGSPAQMDRACSHQTDGTTPANRLLALIPCLEPSAGQVTSRTQIGATNCHGNVLSQTTQTSTNIATNLHFLCSGRNGQYFLVLSHVAGSIIGPVIRI